MLPRCLTRTLVGILLAIVSTLHGGAVRPAGIQSQCGNGIVEPEESCDDGNLLSGDGCDAACSIEQSCFDSGDEFSFFLWSDSYTAAGISGARRVMRDAVDRNRYPGRIIPRFWISPGDIPYMATSVSTLDDINNEISNSPAGQRYPFVCSASSGKFPYFVALGNHDVDGTLGTTPEFQYNYWRTVVAPHVPTTLVGLTNFQEGPQSPDGHDMRTNYSFDYKNAHFVIVNQYFGDTAYPDGALAPLGCIRQPLFEWMDQDLAASDKPIKFVVGHEPAWSYCSSRAGYGGSSCPVGHEDNLDPANRQRPGSLTGEWPQPYGRHWGDSLDDSRCGNRDSFWSMLSRHRVVAHLVGHTHTYSSRLVRGDGVRRNDVSAFAKTGEIFNSAQGVWEVDSAQVHTSGGAAYVLATVRGNDVTFEAYDIVGDSEPFRLIESWTVKVGGDPMVELTAPRNDAFYFNAPLSIPLAAYAADGDGPVTSVTFQANGVPVGTASSEPFTYLWSDVPAGTYELTAVATDGQGETIVSSPITIKVFDGANHAPAVDPIANQGVDELSALRFTASGTDPEGGPLAFSLSQAPPGATIDSATGAFSWTPPETAGPGVYQVTVRATETASTVFAETSVGITVREVNLPPVLAPVNSLTGVERSPVVFNASATDADLPANILTYGLAGAPTGASIDASTGAFAWTPAAGQQGVHNFSVTVSDGSLSLPVSQPVTITVTAASSPDLVLTAIGVTSATLQPGAAVTVMDTVKNQGSGSAAASSIGYVLSPDAGYGGADDVPVAALRAVTELAAGGSSSASIVLVIPAAVPLSSYFVCGRADNGAAVAEGDEENNTRCSTGRITTSRPDLRLTLLEPVVATAVAGGTVSLVNAVKNDGLIAAGSSVVTFRMSVNQVFGDADDIVSTTTRSISSIAAGATSQASTKVKLPTQIPAGAYYACAQADTGAAVAEINETNNTLCSAARFVVPPPDLLLAALTSVAYASPGFAVETRSTATNQGGSMAGPFIIGFSLSPDAAYGGPNDIVLAKTRAHTSLNAGASSGTTNTPIVPLTVAAGPYYMCAHIDLDATVVESVETNNTHCSTSPVVITFADLVVAAVSPTVGSVLAGASLGVANTVRNDGPVSTGRSTTVAFRLSTNAVYGDSDDRVITTTRSASTLAAGAVSAATTSFVVPSSTPAGSYFVCARADSTNVVTETLENNNTACSAQPVAVTH